MRASLLISLTLLLTGCAREPGGSTRTQDHALSTPGLARLLAAIPAGQGPSYGLPTDMRLDKATLGRRYRMLTPRLPGRGTWEEMVAPLDVWRAPLILEGEHLALVTLAVQQGRLQAVELGAAALARELKALEPSLPPGEVGILRVYGLAGDFLITGHGARRRGIPLASARAALELLPEPLSGAALLDLLAEMDL